MVLATARTDRPMVNSAESIRRWQARSQSNWRPGAGQHEFIAAKCPVLATWFVAILAAVGQYMSKSVRAVLDSVCLSRHQRRSADQTGTTGAKSEGCNHDTQRLALAGRRNPRPMRAPPARLGRPRNVLITWRRSPPWPTARLTVELGNRASLRRGQR
jgi:hypothetical protein